MKYILTNKQLFNSIYNFINDELYDDDLTWEYEWDSDAMQREMNVINFYGAKYISNEQDEVTFTYIKKEYYESKEGTPLAEKWIDKSPLLEFIDYEFRNKMNSIFGEYWRPVFEKWFERNYPEFPVKTFIYHN